ncbi:unnamed protein product [Closterium sp. Naga37s-1]|nr:unnamed protein product [Closterium sp. Naga37s-1]
MQRHQRTTKHRDAIRNQELALAKAAGQHRIPDCPKARDVEHDAVEALLDTMLFITKSDTPIEMWVQLVRHLASRGTPGFPKNGYGTYYTTYGFAELVSATSSYLRAKQAREHEFTLHEEAIPGYSASDGDIQSCIRTCRSFATELLYNLDFRLGDLTNLNAAKLFMPRTWPRGKEARDEECKEHMEKLAVMFHARDRDEILPVARWRTTKKRRPTKRKAAKVDVSRRSGAVFRGALAEKRDHAAAADDDAAHADSGGDSDASADDVEEEEDNG